MADARFYITEFTYRRNHPDGAAGPRYITSLRARLMAWTTRPPHPSLRRLDQLDEHLLADVGLERTQELVGWTPAPHGEEPTPIVKVAYRCRTETP